MVMELAWRCPTSMLTFTPPQCNSLASRKAFPCFLWATTHQGFSQRRFSTTRIVRGIEWRRMVVSTNGSPEPDGASSGGLGSTRLGRLIAVRRRELLQRWNKTRRHFPSKIFMLLLGFFFANALATILGQTGDWDVIAAGILVAIIEGIGHLMYSSRLLPAFLGKRGKNILELVNYWKIGFTFALFVDAFKVGS